MVSLSRKKGLKISMFSKNFEPDKHGFLIKKNGFLTKNLILESKIWIKILTKNLILDKIF